MTHDRAVLIVMSLAAAVACEESSREPCGDGGATALAVGAAPVAPGDPAFTELHDGSDFVVVYGPHGLWMSQVALRACGIDLGDPADHHTWPAVAVTIWQGTAAVGGGWARGNEFTADGSLDMLTVSFIDEALTFVGTPALLEVSVTDRRDRIAARSVEVVPSCYPDPDSSYALYCPDGPGNWCWSCSNFADACSNGCDTAAVLGSVCEGTATMLATALVDCMCAECAAECELSCSGGGADAGCGACIEAAVSGTCATEMSDCVGGS